MESLSEHPRSIASRLGKYEIIARLGKGGMARIYLGVARGVGGFHKLVVLKRLESSDDSFRQMFLDEARLAALLHHPNVVNTYEVSETEGSYFIAMEYLEGQSLDEIIREIKNQGRALEPPFCARVLADALIGLHYVHELCDYAGAPLNIVHRDISPHNLFLTYEGNVKVLDFGVAKAEGNIAETGAGILKGKLAYMAPEQAGEEPVDRRADVFSVGAVLWETLTLQRLRSEQTAAGVLNEALHAPLPDLASLRPGLDLHFETVLWRALSRSPQRRYQTAQEMRQALLDYLSAHPCSQEDLADFMHARFGALRSRTQRQINECLRRSENQGPVISITTEEDNTTALVAQVDALPRDLPLLDSGSLPLTSEDVTTPLAPDAMGPSTAPPPPLPDASGATRSRSLIFAEAPEEAGHGKRWLVVTSLVAGAALVWFWLQRSSLAEISKLASQARPDPALTTPPETLLRLHGSNTIGQELAPSLVEAFLKKKGLTGIERSGMQDNGVVKGRDPHDGKLRQIEVAARGSATAFTDLTAGACDVGMSSRRIKPEEATELMAKGLGDLQSPAGEHVLGLDGIAVIVHPNSPLQRIDLATLRRVFTGEISDYRALVVRPVRFTSTRATTARARSTPSSTYAWQIRPSRPTRRAMPTARSCLARLRAISRLSASLASPTCAAPKHWPSLNQGPSRFTRPPSRWPRRATRFRADSTSTSRSSG